MASRHPTQPVCALITRIRYDTLYRAVDGTGQTIDFLLCAKRDKKAARRFFKRALGRENTRNPREVVTELLWSQSKAA